MYRYCFAVLGYTSVNVAPRAATRLWCGLLEGYVGTYGVTYGYSLIYLYVAA